MLVTLLAVATVELMDMSSVASMVEELAVLMVVNLDVRMVD